jgi:hypothetical protein
MLYGPPKKWVLEESYKHSKIFATVSGISGTKIAPWNWTVQVQINLCII